MSLSCSFPIYVSGFWVVNVVERSGRGGDEGYGKARFWLSGKTSAEVGEPSNRASVSCSIAAVPGLWCASVNEEARCDIFHNGSADIPAAPPSYAS